MVHTHLAAGVSCRSFVEAGPVAGMHVVMGLGQVAGLGPIMGLLVAAEALAVSVLSRGCPLLW